METVLFRNKAYHAKVYIMFYFSWYNVLIMFTVQLPSDVLTLV